jgi:hypothetical protein
MSTCRITLPVTLADARQAFVTGKFTGEVMGYLKNHNIGTVVVGLPKNATSITLTPDILTLEEGKQCGIFLQLPAHVNEIKFNFQGLQKDQLTAFTALMAHSPYAANVKTFALTMDFNRFSLPDLQAKLMKNTFPQQLETFVLNGPGAESISNSDAADFKRFMLKDTDVVCASTSNLTVSKSF